MTRLYRIGFLAWAAFAAWGGDVPAASAEPRVALVVGNTAYRNAPPLRNPVNDARDMAKALQELGFDVIKVENGTKQQLERAIGQFSAKLTEGSVGLFFYSGHGLQLNGRNYLIPVDAELASEASVRLETTDIDLVLDLMNLAQTRVNLVILDACRSNPFDRRFRGLGRGLAPVEQAPRGTLVAYSTAPGKVASDGDGANGLYTAELLKALRTPGLKVEEVFKTVRIAVSTASNEAQTPWESSSLTGDFFFRPLAPPPPPPSAPPADQVVWDVIKDAASPGPFEAFLKSYPNSQYAESARAKLAVLARPPPPTPPAPPTPAAPAADAVVWNVIKDGAAPDPFEAFLRNYPDSQYAGAARAKLAALAKPAPPPPAPAVPTPAMEGMIWAMIKDGASAGPFEEYLQTYPNGRHAGAARAKLAEVSRAPPTPQAASLPSLPRAEPGALSPSSR